MKKPIFIFLFALLSLSGFSQVVMDPQLSEELARRSDEEKIKVVVSMKSQYDRTALNRRADHFVTRAERREFVVNELKAFASASQYNLRRSLSEMERQGMVSSPTILWMANALYFDANKTAILDLAQCNDVARMGYVVESQWLPDDELLVPASSAREITQNVTKVRADQVWALGYRGEGVVVAVIDSGVNYNHVDLADHLWDGGEEFPHHGYDVINQDDDPMDDHEYGHGTHCAGTVCGDGTAGSQTGMAPDATLMCVKCMTHSGYTHGVYIAEGIQWAVEHGCDLFSMSVGRGKKSQVSVSERVLLRNACEAALDAGVVAAIAVGNEGKLLDVDDYLIPFNVRVPGGCPPPYMDEVQSENPGGLSCVVSVGAVDYNDEAPSTTSWTTSQGPYSWEDTEFGDYPYNPGIGLIRPDVCAPGVNIKSLNVGNITGYRNMSGTSMAAPCVAGCMALLLSKNHNLTPAEVCCILEETAVPLSEGKSNIYGFGRVDALAAIEAVPMVGIRYRGLAVNDSMGNDNHRLNPGESVSMSLTLTNIYEEPVSGVSAVLTTENEHVTLMQDTIVFPDFAAFDTITMEDAFAFSVDNEVMANQKISFFIEIYVDGELVGKNKDKILVYDYQIDFGVAAVLNDSNGDGFFNPGEDATLRVMIENNGNEMAQMLTGTLSADCSMLVLHETEKPFGTVGAGRVGYADFNLTLDAAASEAVALPFVLDLVDANGRHTELTFTYKNVCKVIFSLYDSFSDGWQDNYLLVEYSDGTPSEQMTIENGGFAEFVRELAFSSTLTLTWHSGSWSQECRFEITCEDGTVIFQNSGGFSDTQTFAIDCPGGYGMPEFCEPVCHLDYETNGHQVVLSWDAPENGTPTAYEVYRETVLVETTNEQTAVDYIEEGVYNYCVYALYNNCPSEYVCQEVVIRNMAPEIHIIEVREGKIATAWTMVEDAVAYNLYRDNNLIAENLTDTIFTDTEMAINAQHCYAVASVFEQGVSDLSEATCANYYMGLDENDGKVSIYPNPTSDRIIIQCVGMKLIEVYSTEGRLVRSLEVNGDACQIDGLESGMYLVRIDNRKQFLVLHL